MQFIQFSWQGDPQLLVEGQSFKPVLQLLERWTEGEGGRKRARGHTEGFEFKTRLTRLRKNMRKQSGSRGVSLCRQVEMASESSCFFLYSFYRLLTSNSWSGNCVSR